MANEIAVYDRVQNPMEFVEKMGTSMAQSGMFGCKNVQQGMVLAMACLTEKKNPIELARTYHIIDGQLSMRADAMLAEFRNRGGKCRWLNIGDDGQEARAIFTFDEQELEVAFTIGDARKMELVRQKSNWVKNPGAMLRARCTSKAVRILAPEIVAGVYAPEELGDGEGVRAATGDVIEGEFTWPNTPANGKAAEKEAAPKVDAKELIRQKAAERAAANAAATAAATDHQSLPGDNGDTPAEPAAADEEATATTATAVSTEAVAGEVGGDEGDEGHADETAADDPSDPPFDTADAGTPEPQVMTAPSNGPCTDVQVNQIKAMLAELRKSDPEIGNKVKKALASQGILALSDMTRFGAEELLRKLYQKAAGERLSQPSEAAGAAAKN